MFIKFIAYSIALYFIMKAVKIIARYFTHGLPKERPEVKQSRTSQKINKRDIVEAEFEEITDNEEEK